MTPREPDEEDSPFANFGMRARVIGAVMLALGSIIYFTGLIPYETKEHARELYLQQQKDISSAVTLIDATNTRIDRLQDRVETLSRDQARIMERLGMYGQRLKGDP